MFTKEIQRIFAAGPLSSGSQKVYDQTLPVISINHLTARAGTLYERLRYLVDYKEESTIRRSAVERIIRRTITLENKVDIGRTLLEELISAGYLPNNTIPEQEAQAIDVVIDAYRILVPTLRQKIKLSETERTMLSILASEIENYLFPNSLDVITCDALFNVVQSITKHSGPIADDAFDTALFVACHRTLLKGDDDAVLYALWCRELGIVPGSLNVDILSSVGDVRERVQRIRKSLTHRIVPLLMGKIKNDSICFSIMRELIKSNPEQAQLLFSDRGAFEDHVKAFLESKYRLENSKVIRSGIRAILYIFCTKMLIALALEVPYSYYILQRIDYVPLVVNILFHPALLFVITRTIKPLGQRNTDRIIARLTALVYGGDVAGIMVRYKPSFGKFDILFTLIYGLMFVATFGILTWVLTALRFNPVSTFLFVIFLLLVSYFGLRIRHNAVGWRVRIDQERIIFVIGSFFTLPIVKVGRLLSEKFASINVFVFILDVLIEAPFKTLLKIVDSFIFFLRYKREETY